MPPEQCGHGATELVTPNSPGWSEQDAATGGAQRCCVRQALAQVPDRRRALRLLTHQRESSSAWTPTVTAAGAICGWTPERRTGRATGRGSGELTGKPPTPHRRCTNWPGCGSTSRAAGEDTPGPRCQPLVRASTGQWVTSTDRRPPRPDGRQTRQYPRAAGDGRAARDQVCDRCDGGGDRSASGRGRRRLGSARDTVVVAGLGDGQAAGLGAGDTERGRSTQPGTAW